MIVHPYPCTHVWQVIPPNVLVCSSCRAILVPADYATFDELVEIANKKNKEITDPYDRAMKGVR